MTSNAPIKFELCLDIDRDYTFDNANDDISAYVIDLNWQNGFTQLQTDTTGYDDLGQPARLTIQLSNESKDFNPEQLGAELITNGDFSSWVGGDPSSWIVTGEVFSVREVSQVGIDKSYGDGGTGSCNVMATAGTVSLGQNVTVSGHTYRITFKITKIKAGTESSGIRIKSGSLAVTARIHQVGNYTFYFTAVSNAVTIESSGTPNITIDDVSVKEVSKYGHNLYPGALFRLRAIHAAVTYPLFYGVISHDPGSIVLGINPTTGQIQDRMVTIIVEDAMHRLLDAQYSPPLLQSVSINSPIQQMFDEGVVRWPYGDYGTMLDIQGTDILDDTARLYGYQTTILSLETGVTVLDFVGDLADSGAGVSAQGYIRDLLAAEAGGRFWFEARTGKFTFHNRQHDVLNNTLAATYAQSVFNSVKTSYADSLINEVTINFTSRTIGAAHTTVYNYKSVPFLLKSGDVRTFTCRYTDPNNDKVRIGVLQGDLPVPGLDYIGNAAQNGGGNDLTGDIVFSAQFKAASAQVTMSNNSGHDVWVQQFQLRATPFVSQDETIIVSGQLGGISIAKYSKSPMRSKTIRYITDAEFAELIAQDYIRRFKDPVFRLASVTLNGANNAAQRVAGLARVIGDKITLTDVWTGHSANYIIVGEQHHAYGAGYKHDVTYTLKPLSREKIAILNTTGQDELDSDNVLGL